MSLACTDLPKDSAFTSETLSCLKIEKVASHQQEKGKES